MALTAASSAVGAVGSIQEGRAQKGMAEYNADVYEQNAVAATNKAAFDATRQREVARKILSSHRATWGASGVTVNSGSPLLDMEELAAEAELDAQAIEYTGKIESMQGRSKAALSRLQGKQAETSSYFKAGTSLLGGASSISGAYRKDQLLRARTGAR